MIFNIKGKLMFNFIRTIIISMYFICLTGCRGTYIEAPEPESLENRMIGMRYRIIKKCYLVKGDDSFDSRYFVTTPAKFEMLQKAIASSKCQNKPLFSVVSILLPGTSFTLSKVMFAHVRSEHITITDNILEITLKVNNKEYTCDGSQIGKRNSSTLFDKEYIKILNNVDKK